METKDYVTLGLSLSALIVSLVTLFLKGPENRRTIRNQLTDALSKLNAVNAEARKLSIEKAADRHTPEVNGMFSFFNDQRAFLVRQAVFLADQIPAHVSDIEYSLIARALGNAGDHVSALTYWSKSIAASKDTLQRAMRLRGFAAYHFEQGDVDSGRKCVKESVSLLAGDDDFRKHTVGETYLRWANLERDAGDALEFGRLMDCAREAFSSIKSKPLRAHGVAVLESSTKKQ